MSLSMAAAKQMSMVATHFGGAGWDRRRAGRAARRLTGGVRTAVACVDAVGKGIEQTLAILEKQLPYI
jgi:hypothetical protein